MKVKAIKTTIFPLHGNLLSFITKYLPRISNRSILVITSKIIALSEGRVVKDDKGIKEKIVRKESELVLPTKYVFLTIKDGMIMANAGLDDSNGNGLIILLPKDSFNSAVKIRNYFKKKYQLKDFGVIITDSRCLPLRAGVVGAALGYAGFKGLKSYEGKPDIFGRLFKYSRVDIADSLATAAVLVMGEGKEKQPLAIISEAPVEYTNKVNKDELKIDIKEDLYGPLFSQIK